MDEAYRSPGWTVRETHADGSRKYVAVCPDLEGREIPEWEHAEEVDEGVTRGGVRRVKLDGRWLYIREYRHGGALGGLFGNRFRDGNTGFRELEILDRLQAADVRVPTPAYLEQRLRLRPRWFPRFLRVRIGTWGVPGHPLAVVLGASRKERRSALEAAAGQIRRMHDVGILHGDLHLNNILWDGERASLLDFDHAQAHRALSGEARWRELLRLLRSARKRPEGLACNTPDALRFLKAYAAGEADWEEGLASRMRGFEKEVRRRSLLWR